MTSKEKKIVMVYTPLGYLTPEAFKKLKNYGLFDKMKRKQQCQK